MKDSDALYRYKCERATREMLEAMLHRFQKRERDLLEIVKAEIAASPLVETSNIEFAGLQILVLTAKRRGLLSDMIRTGINASLPEPNWVSTTSYTEPHSVVAGRSVMFEEMFADTLSLLGHTLPLGVLPRMLEANLLQEATHHVDSEELGIRVSDIFVSPKLQQWRESKFSTTLFMSEFGPGSRIFLRAA